MPGSDRAASPRPWAAIRLRDAASCERAKTDDRATSKEGIASVAGGEKVGRGQTAACRVEGGWEEVAFQGRLIAGVYSHSGF